MSQYVVIGNGVAGVRAMEAILRRDDEARVVAVTDEVHAFYLRPQLPAYVAGRVGEGALRGKALDRLDPDRYDLRLGVRAERVDPDAHTVTLDDGDVLSYDRLILAPGAAPCPVDLPNADVPGVVRLTTLEQARHIRLMAQEARSAVVVGGGIHGVELLAGLIARGIHATYLLAEERFWPEALDPTAGDLALHDLAAAGVDVRVGADLEEIRSRNGRLVAAVTDGGELIECQILGIGYGYTPAAGFLRGSGIEIDRGILVDDRLRTSAPDVFAAGDAAQLREPAPGTTGSTVRWQNAWTQGHVAGGNAAGLDVSFPTMVTTTSSRMCGHDFVVLGEGHLPAGEGLTEMTGPYPRDGVYKRLVARDGRLTGALLYGDVTEATELIGHVRDRTPTENLPAGLTDRLFGVETGSADQVLVCPACKLKMPFPPDAAEGDIVTCPACGIEIRLQRRAGRLVGVAV